MLNYLNALAKALRSNSRRSREMAYLNGAVDRYDLEARERDVDRGLFHDRLASHLG
jgi:hypothetical protein